MISRAALSVEGLASRVGRALVTGASGFIGSHLVDHLLSRGVAVTCLRHRAALQAPAGAARVVEADLCDLRSILTAMEGVATVFHLAGMSAAATAQSFPDEAFRVNTGGTQSILEAARRSGDPRVILLSTAHVFGSPARLPVTEDHAFSPTSIYAATKLAGDVMAAGYSRSFGLRVTTLRLFNIYGPRQAPVAVIPEIIQQALAGVAVRPRKLYPRRDFLYVGDAVDAIVRAAVTPASVGQEILLASGRAVSIAELVRRVVTLVSGLPTERPEEPGDSGDCLFGTAERARALLGWQPHIDLNAGLARTVSWWRRQTRTSEGVREGRNDS